MRVPFPYIITSVVYYVYSSWLPLSMEWDEISVQFSFEFFWFLGDLNFFHTFLGHLYFLVSEGSPLFSCLFGDWVICLFDVQIFELVFWYINSQLEGRLANILSHYVTSIFIPLFFFAVCQNLFNLTLSKSLILGFISWALSSLVKEVHATPIC